MLIKEYEISLRYRYSVDGDIYECVNYSEGSTPLEALSMVLMEHADKEHFVVEILGCDLK